MLSEQELFELFSKQQNWQDRYRQLIRLSKQISGFPDDQKTAENQVNGCENRVWLICQKQLNHRLVFRGESDGRIVKGLLAVLLILANEKTADEIHKIDFHAKLDELNVIEGLSSTRQFGVAELINRIKQLCVLSNEYKPPIDSMP